MQFKQIIGQGNIKKRLINSVYTNRVSHAQLFFGPEGCGKLSLAIAYAQFINCENKQPDDSCGECPSCLQYNALAHPDLHFIYPIASSKNSKPLSKNYISQWREFLSENNYHVSLNQWYEKLNLENKQGTIFAEDCNEIIRTTGMKSYEAEYKVVIIWMIEKLFHAASPKLLKTLEEPPEKSLFILITENQNAILNTIRSRTQLINIPKFSNQTLIHELVSKFDVTEINAKKIIAQSNGNYIKAINLIGEDQEEIFYFNTFREWMRICFNINMAQLADFTNNISTIGREKQKRLFQYSLNIIHEIISQKFQKVSVTKSNEEENTFISKFSAFIHLNNMPLIYDELNKAMYHIERNANPKILFTDLSFTINKLLKS